MNQFDLCCVCFWKFFTAARLFRSDMQIGVRMDGLSWQLASVCVFGYPFHFSQQVSGSGFLRWPTWRTCYWSAVPGEINCGNSQATCKVSRKCKFYANFKVDARICMFSYSTRSHASAVMFSTLSACANFLFVCCEFTQLWPYLYIRLADIVERENVDGKCSRGSREGRRDRWKDCVFLICVLESLAGTISRFEIVFWKFWKFYFGNLNFEFCTPLTFLGRLPPCLNVSAASPAWKERSDYYIMTKLNVVPISH